MIAFFVPYAYAQQSPTLRIGTYNVNSEQKCEGKIDLQKLRMNRLADVIIQENIDIISLQEMEDWRMAKNGSTHEMRWPEAIYDAQYLKEELDRRGRPMALFDTFQEPRAGLRVVTLSTYPAVPNTLETFLFTGDGNSRHSHLLKINTSIGPLWFVSIHTHYESARAHIDFLNNLLQTRFPSEKKVIVSGDFNASAGGSAMDDHLDKYQVVGGAGTLTDKISIPKDGDFVAVSNKISGDPSDRVCPEANTDSHSVVIATIKLKDGLPQPAPATTVTPPLVQPPLILGESVASASAQTKSTGYIPLWMYVWISIVYVLIMQHALQIRTQFNRFFFYGAFVFGAMLGYFFNNYLFGFFVAIVLSLILW
jgi:endonuclease/exonuclease/phosphatase family metal-dependent hydrolase